MLVLSNEHRVVGGVLFYGSVDIHIFVLPEYRGKHFMSKIHNNGILKAELPPKQKISLNINDIYLAILASMFLSFGGFCIHFQVISVINDTDIKYSNFFIARIFHMIISGILAYLIYYLYFGLFT